MALARTKSKGGGGPGGAAKADSRTSMIISACTILVYAAHASVKEGAPLQKGGASYFKEGAQKPKGGAAPRYDALAKAL